MKSLCSREYFFFTDRCHECTTYGQFSNHINVVISPNVWIILCRKSEIIYHAGNAINSGVTKFNKWGGQLSNRISRSKYGNYLKCIWGSFYVNSDTSTIFPRMIFMFEEIVKLSKKFGALGGNWGNNWKMHSKQVVLFTLGFN